MFTENFVWSEFLPARCGMVLQSECRSIDPIFSFTVNVSPGQPINQPKSVHTPPSADDLKIIHITDLHYDEHYMEGGFGNCINPVCCRRSDGIPTNPADRAGFWGDYRVYKNIWILEVPSTISYSQSCDSPWRAVEDVLRRVRLAHPDADYIYHTGDIIDHGVWETSFDGNRRIMDRVFNMFREVFGNTPVHHVLGNHEGHPTNQWVYILSYNRRG